MAFLYNVKIKTPDKEKKSITGMLSKGTDWDATDLSA